MDLKDIKIISCDSDPLTEAEIARIVSVIGPIPDDYKQFLLKYNGGRIATPDDLMFEFGSFQDSEFYNNRFSIRRFAIVEAEFPPQIITGEFAGRYIRMIEVAGEYQCPILLMSLDVNSFGSIYCWVVDNEKLWEAEDTGTLYLPNEENTRFVASSFSQYIEGTVPEPDGTVIEKVDISKMEHTVDNFAKYGDKCFFDATAFLDKLSVEQLDERWPKEAKYSYPPVLTAIGYKQINIVRYLISRGVEFESKVSRTAHSVEISEIIIKAARNPDEVKQSILLAAASGISSTTQPEHKESVVEWLTHMGVQPDFSDAEVLKEWESRIVYFGSKKTIRFLQRHIKFPPGINDKLDAKLDKRTENAVGEYLIMKPSASDQS